MKLGELKLPCKVKLNGNFTLEESFDENTILLLRNKKLDWEGGPAEADCYKVEVTALKEDEKHNKLVARHDWYDKNSKPVLSIYEAQSEWYDSNGDFNTSIYVMEDDDCFELITKPIERKWRGTSDFDWEGFKKYIDTYEPIKHSFDDFCIIEDIVYGIGRYLDEKKYKDADGYKRFLIDLNGQFVEKYNKNKTV